MVGYDRAKRDPVGLAKSGYVSDGDDCGKCIHFDRKGGNKTLGPNIGGCNLHSFIPYTSTNNVCDTIEKK